MPKITPAHVWFYRALGGRLVDKGTGGAPVLLVTTRGRRTGEPRTVPLGHLRDGDDVIVAGTNGGLESLPSWVLNLRADPSCTVELGSEQFDAYAEFLEDDEWEHHWSRLVDAFPVYDQAHRWAGRPIPLVRLKRQAEPGDQRS
jgi:deazaflavin-dependent oxidoreductase (nitroreductase family)